MIQRMAARIICQVPRCAHSAPLLEELGLASLEDRRNLRVIGSVQNCINKICHPALTELFVQDPVDIAKVLEGNPRTVAGKRKFSHSASILYNNNTNGLTW